MFSSAGLRTRSTAEDNQPPPVSEGLSNPSLQEHPAASSLPFSVRSLLKESVFERPESEMTLEPSLTARLMDW